MQRRRVSVDQSLVNRAGLNQLVVERYTSSNSDTDQVVDEVRTAAGPDAGASTARGTLDYTQDSYGGALQGRKAARAGQPGAAVHLRRQLQAQHLRHAPRSPRHQRRRPAPWCRRPNLILPTKYFPKSDVGETGAYVQARDAARPRLTLVPGRPLRPLLARTPTRTIAVYLATLSPAPADFSADAVSSQARRVGAASSNAVTLHAQYAGGFRAPPYSAVNSGFTNLRAATRRFRTPTCDARDQRQLRGRRPRRRSAASASASPASRTTTTTSSCRCQRGVNPSTGLLEYQYQNVSKVKIHGVELHGEARLAPIAPAARRLRRHPRRRRLRRRRGAAEYRSRPTRASSGCSTPRRRIAGAAS